jgi:hypothetical protein
VAPDIHVDGASLPLSLSLASNHIIVSLVVVAIDPAPSIHPLEGEKKRKGGLPAVGWWFCWLGLVGDARDIWRERCFALAGV